jgi:hypothetical protein
MSCLWNAHVAFTLLKYIKLWKLRIEVRCPFDRNGSLQSSPLSAHLPMGGNVKCEPFCHVSDKPSMTPSCVLQLASATMALAVYLMVTQITAGSVQVDAQKFHGALQQSWDENRSGYAANFVC